MKLATWHAILDLSTTPQYPSQRQQACHQKPLNSRPYNSLLIPASARAQPSQFQDQCSCNHNYWASSVFMAVPVEKRKRFRILPLYNLCCSLQAIIIATAAAANTTVVTGSCTLVVLLVHAQPTNRKHRHRIGSTIESIESNLPITVALPFTSHPPPPTCHRHPPTSHPPPPI